MESFKVSALKYRPKSFNQVIGQEMITSTLQNAIDSNQLAQALLFCGPRGVGKTSCARILAKAINEKTNSSSDQDYSFNIFELDAASNNGVDEIRRLNEQVRIPPQIGSFKVYIIDEVHMLSIPAFNAFLKTLEEPPKHAIFILATTEKNKIIPTILSRCQIYDFKRISVKKIRDSLIKICEDKNVKYDDDSLILIAKKADGAMRDALSIFDRMVSFTSGNLFISQVSKDLNILSSEIFITLLLLIKDNKIPDLLLKVNEIINDGFDSIHLINGLANHIRMLILCKDSSTISLLEVSSDLQEKYINQSKIFNFDWLIDALSIIKDTESNHKLSLNKRLNSELCLMKLSSLHFNGEKKN